MAATAAQVAGLRRRIRKVAADIPPTRPSLPTPSGFGSGPGRRAPGATKPTLRDTQKQSVENSAKALRYSIWSLTNAARFIDVPVRKLLDGVVRASHELKDPTMAEKAKQKFHRIFGEMFSSVELIQSNLAPILHELDPVAEGEKLMESRAAKNLVDALDAALPLVRSGFKSLDPRSHEAAVNTEIQKQTQFLEQIKKVLASTGVENPATRVKLEGAAQFAEVYLEGLRELIDPMFADRIQNNVDKSLNEYIPKVIQAAKAFAKEFGATEKAASISQSQKRLRKVAKRIVLLAYLRSKSL